MLFKYRFLLHFHKMNVNGDLELEKVPERCTRSKIFICLREPAAAEGIGQGCEPLECIPHGGGGNRVLVSGRKTGGGSGAVICSLVVETDCPGCLCGQ